MADPVSFQQLGPKLCIIGCSNTGKSTLADAIFKKHHLPAFHLDLLAHKPGTRWVRTSSEALVDAQAEIFKQPTWVIDGNYSVCMKPRFDEATAVIWLDFNVMVCLLRYIRRIFQRNPKRPGRLSNAKNEFSWWLMKHILFTYPKNRKKYAALLKTYPDLLVVRVTSVKMLKRCYQDWEL